MQHNKNKVTASCRIKGVNYDSSGSSFAKTMSNLTAQIKEVTEHI
jgi:hypothetical protein